MYSDQREEFAEIVEYPGTEEFHDERRSGKFAAFALVEHVFQPVFPGQGRIPGLAPRGSRAGAQDHEPEGAGAMVNATRAPQPARRTSRTDDLVIIGLEIMILVMGAVCLPMLLCSKGGRRMLSALD
jgi:hypothetical protein